MWICMYIYWKMCTCLIIQLNYIHLKWKLSPKYNLGFFCECTWVKPLCKSIILTKEALLRFTVFSFSGQTHFHYCFSLKWVWPKNENTANLKCASFVVMMLFCEGLTNIHSQISLGCIFVRVSTVLTLWFLCTVLQRFLLKFSCYPANEKTGCKKAFLS